MKPVVFIPRAEDSSQQSADSRQQTPGARVIVGTPPYIN